METFSLISIISIALLGSFGHCIGMCGGIVVAYSSTKIKVNIQNYSKCCSSFVLFWKSYNIYNFRELFWFYWWVVTFQIQSGFLLITGFDGNSWIFHF